MPFNYGAFLKAWFDSRWVEIYNSVVVIRIGQQYLGTPCEDALRSQSELNNIRSIRLQSDNGSFQHHRISKHLLFSQQTQYFEGISTIAFPIDRTVQQHQYFCSNIPTAGCDRTQQPDDRFDSSIRRTVQVELLSSTAAFCGSALDNNIYSEIR